VHEVAQAVGTVVSSAVRDELCAVVLDLYEPGGVAAGRGVHALGAAGSEDGEQRGPDDLLIYRMEIADFLLDGCECGLAVQLVDLLFRTEDEV